MVQIGPVYDGRDAARMNFDRYAERMHLKVTQNVSSRVYPVGITLNGHLECSSTISFRMYELEGDIRTYGVEDHSDRMHFVLTQKVSPKFHPESRILHTI